MFIHYKSQLVVNEHDNGHGQSLKLAKKMLWVSPRAPCAPSFLKSWIRPCHNTENKEEKLNR